MSEEARIKLGAEVLLVPRNAQLRCQDCREEFRVCHAVFRSLMGEFESLTPRCPKCGSVLLQIRCQFKVRTSRSRIQYGETTVIAYDEQEARRKAHLLMSEDEAQADWGVWQENAPSTDGASPVFLEVANAGRRLSVPVEKSLAPDESDDHR